MSDEVEQLKATIQRMNEERETEKRNMSDKNEQLKATIKRMKEERETEERKRVQTSLRQNWKEYAERMTPLLKGILIDIKQIRIFQAGKDNETTEEIENRMQYPIRSIFNNVVEMLKIKSHVEDESLLLALKKKLKSIAKEKKRIQTGLEDFKNNSAENEEMRREGLLKSSERFGPLKLYVEHLAKLFQTISASLGDDSGDDEVVDDEVDDDDSDDDEGDDDEAPNKNRKRRMTPEELEDPEAKRAKTTAPQTPGPSPQDPSATDEPMESNTTNAAVPSNQQRTDQVVPSAGGEITESLANRVPENAPETLQNQEEPIVADGIWNILELWMNEIREVPVEMHENERGEEGDEPENQLEESGNVDDEENESEDVSEPRDSSRGHLSQGEDDYELTSGAGSSQVDTPMEMDSYEEDEDFASQSPHSIPGPSSSSSSFEKMTKTPRRQAAMKSHNLAANRTPKRGRSVRMPRGELVEKMRQPTLSHTVGLLLSRAEEIHKIVDEATKRRLYQFASTEYEEFSRNLEVTVANCDDLVDQGNFRGVEKSMATAVEARCPLVERNKTPTPKKVPSAKNEIQTRAIDRTLFDLSFRGPLHIEKNTSGEEILKKAKESISSQQNLIYNAEKTVSLPQGDLEICQKELESFKSNCQYEGHQDLIEGTIEWFEQPTPVVYYKRDDDDNIRKLVQSRPFVAIRGLKEATGFDMSLFSMSAISKCTKKILVLQQFPQKPNSNVDPETGTKTWSTKSSSAARDPQPEFEDFFAEVQKPNSILDKAMDSLLSESATAKQLEELKDKLSSEHLVKKHKPRLMLGSILEFTKESLKVLMKEVKKLPQWLQPNNPDDLMRNVGQTLGGINSIQMCYKQVGSRTTAHVENLALGSINWNFGPGHCIWYVVPIEFCAQMKKLIENSGETIYGQYWPLVDEVKAAGIPIQVFLQKPGDLVYVGTGSFHWVQSLGTASNLSWNIAPPTKLQLDAMAVFYDHQRHTPFKRQMPVIPLQLIILNIVINGKFKNDPVMRSSIDPMWQRVLARMLLELEQFNKIKDSNEELVQLENFSAGSFDCGACGVKMLNLYLLRKSTGKEKKKFCVFHRGERSNYQNTYHYRFSAEQLLEIHDKYMDNTAQ